MIDTSGGRRTFRPYAPKAYLGRVAPFAAVALVEVAVLMTVAFAITDGGPRWVVGMALCCFAAFAGVAMVRPALARHELTDWTLRVRCGARLDWSVPRSAIRGARVVPSTAISPMDRYGGGARVVGDRLVAVIGEPSLVEITFSDPVPLEIRRLRGWVRTAIIGVEAAEDFVTTLGVADASEQPHVPLPPLNHGPRQSPRPVEEAPARLEELPPEPVIVSVRGVTQRFGALTVVESVSLSVFGGELVALVGGNGSGKSTTLRILAGVLQPTEGEVAVGGDAAGSVAAKAITGYVPDRPVFYERLTGREHLLFVAQCHQLPDAAARVDELLARFRLRHAADVPTSTYSLGMAKKLTIAAALLHEPSALLADEPTIGLDLRTTGTIIEIFEERRAEGLATMVATHDLAIADLADRIVVIEEGGVRFEGTPADLRVRAGHTGLEEALLGLSS